MIRLCLFGGLLALGAVGAANAAAITTFSDNVSFTSTGQSLFAGAAHPNGEFDLTIPIVDPSTNGPISLSIGPGFDSTTGLGGQASITSTGEFGAAQIFGATGGQIDSSVQAKFGVTVPVGNLTAGTPFTASATGNLAGGNFHVQGPAMDAGINAIINFRNHLSGEICLVPFVSAACLGGSTDLNFVPSIQGLPPGQLPLLSADTGTGKLNVLGASIPLPAFNSPFNIKSGPSVVPLLVDPSVTIGQVTLSKALDTTVAGNLSGNTLNFSTPDQKQVTLTASIPGLAQLALTGLPIGILRNNIGIPGVLSVGYTLFDAEVGSSFGLSQNFAFNATPTVQLKFSTGVAEQHKFFQFQDCGFDGFDCLFGGQGTIIESPTPDPPPQCTGLFFAHNCTFIGTVFHNVDHPDGVIDVAAGDSLNVSLDGDGRLLERTEFLANPTLTNDTSIGIDPFIQFTALCGQFTLIDVISTGNQCLFNQTDDFGSINAGSIFDKTSPLDGFSPTSFAVDAGPTPIDPGPGPVASAPEPPAWALFATGLIWFTAFARRHRPVEIGSVPRRRGRRR